uniref:Uncharacterized protein n=1 Tax=Knipowitschia caucasica TaxID=637954 RepID=A0AAV2LH70_KNICA
MVEEERGELVRRLLLQRQHMRGVEDMDVRRCEKSQGRERSVWVEREGKGRRNEPTCHKPSSQIQPWRQRRINSWPPSEVIASSANRGAGEAGSPSGSLGKARCGATKVNT